MRLIDRVTSSIGLKPLSVWRAYREVFSGELAKVVLADLSVTSGLLDSVDSDDPIVIARAEGRRQIFLLIMDRLNMTYEDVSAIQKQVDEQLGGRTE